MASLPSAIAADRPSIENYRLEPERGKRMEHDLKFAVVLPLTDFAAARAAAEAAADELGFHAVYRGSFLHGRPGRDRSEPRLSFTLLSALAPLTRRVRLTQVVAGNSYRHPARWRRSRPH
jgi:alkanesulfonate monooxygenase SsuD/methylene tetrahydromethanopterin reductase-like flavin-dependent oxidoreductase (luciferase family)